LHTFDIIHEFDIISFYGKMIVANLSAQEPHLKTIDERIAALEAKLRQEKARKGQIESRRKMVEAKKQRSHETRRKVVVGAVILGKVARGEWPNEKLLALIEPALTRDDDRALFGLEPASQNPPESRGENP
jgi:large subunit ribosomal protein L7/L12